jgi:hypothetical protein
LALTLNVKWALNVDVDNFFTLIMLILMYGFYDVINKCLKYIHCDLIYPFNVATLPWGLQPRMEQHQKKKDSRTIFKNLNTFGGLKRKYF